MDDWSSDPGDPKNPASGAILSQSTEYTYDVFDRRIVVAHDIDGEGTARKIASSHVYNWENIWIDFDEGNQASVRYFTHGDQVDRTIARFRPLEGIAWYLIDRSRSVRDLTDNEGRVHNHFEYGAFGNTISLTNLSVSDRFRYAGREFDEDGQLAFYRTRYYAPSTGSYIATDILGFGGGTANLYQFNLNDPVNFTDPFGTVVVAEEGRLAKLQRTLAPILREVGCEFATTVVQEGVYIFVATIGGQTKYYVGESNKVSRRIREHVASKSVEIEQIINVAIPGDRKADRRKIEQFILDLLGGVPNTHNIRNPVSPRKFNSFRDVVPRC